MNAWAFDRTYIRIKNRTKISEMKEWCHENIGKDWWTDEEDGRWTWISQTDFTEFQFREERDALLFALRWS